MVYCNKDMCRCNNGLYCTRHQVQLEVEIIDDEERLFCRNYEVAEEEKQCT